MKFVQFSKICFMFLYSNICLYILQTLSTNWLNLSMKFQIMKAIQHSLYLLPNGWFLPKRAFNPIKRCQESSTVLASECHNVHFSFFSKSCALKKKKYLYFFRFTNTLHTYKAATYTDFIGL